MLGPRQCWAVHGFPCMQSYVSTSLAAPVKVFIRFAQVLMILSGPLGLRVVDPPEDPESLETSG